MSAIREWFDSPDSGFWIGMLCLVTVAMPPHKGPVWMDLLGIVLGVGNLLGSRWLEKSQ